MKNLIFLMMVLAIGFVTLSSVSSCSGSPPGQQSFQVDQTDLAPAEITQEEGGEALFAETKQQLKESAISNFLINHFPELLLTLFVLIKIIVNLTPTEKDNKVFSFIDSLIDAVIPNLKKGGGTHEVPSI